MAYGLETLTIPNFETYLAMHGFDTTSSTEIVNYLAGLGYTSTVTLDQEIGPPFTGPGTFAQVDVSFGGITNFNTGAGGNSPGFVLLDAATNSSVTVTGTANVAVSTALGNSQINLEGSGKEQAFLGMGDDTVWVGNNTTVPGATGADTIYGGIGNETYGVGSSATKGATFFGGTGSNVFWDFSSVNNVYHGNTAPGTGGESVYLHNSGNDTIYAGSGTDTYDGSNASPGGIDAMFSTGHNSLVAGTGTDVILGSISGGTDTIVGGIGPDTLYAGTNGDSLQSGSHAGGYNVLADFFGAAGGSNTLDGSTGAGNDQLYASSASNDVLKSGAGNDTLDSTGSTGNNTFDIAGAGNNLIRTGSGETTINGGTATGNNLYELYGPLSGSGGGVIAQLGHGSDTVDIATNNGAGFNLTDSITAGSGQDTIDFIGLNQSAASIHTVAGVTTVTFGAQTAVVTASSAPGSDVTLRFADGTTYNAG
jgi:hypothetical protein